MKFKKLFAALLSAVMAFACIGFSACGSKDTLIVYTESGFAPFEYKSNGKIVGVDVEIMEKVGKKLNKKVQFEDVGFDTIVDAVSDGRLCNVGAAGISVNEDRQKKVDFSKEYYTAKLYVIYKAAAAENYESMTTDDVTGVYWESMQGKKIAVQTGTTSDLFLGDELAEDGTLYGTNAKKVSCSALATAVGNVEIGDADVLIIDELPAQQLIKGKDGLKCAPLYYQGGEGESDEAAVDTYAICVTKGKTEILNAINEVLDELGTEGIQALVNKHLGL